MTRDDLQRIDAAIEGTISQADFAALQQAMRDDPAVLRHYRDQAAIHGQLEWELREAAPSSFLATPSPRRHRRQLAAVAAILVLAAAGVVWLAAGPSTNPAPTTATTAPEPSATVAALDASSDAVWAPGATPSGDRVPPGRYSLRSGTATLVFDGGTTIALKSPAEIVVAATDRASILGGHATVHIPDQAVGFLLETPTASLSDQNTRFAIAVDDEGHTELHVLQGVIELVPKFGDATPLLVRSNRPMSVESHAVLEASGSPFNRTDFPALPNRPDRIQPGFVHWSFDRAVSSELSDTSFPDLGVKRPGTPSFPARVQARSLDSAVALVPGRFGNAVQFNGGGGFINTSLPGIPGSNPRTVAFWVRIPLDPPWEQSYSVISWGTKTRGGKWQIGWNHGRDNPGRLGAIRTEVEGGLCVGSTDLRDGRWHHVAVVFLGGEDAKPGTHILHYVDGRLEKTSTSRDVTIHTVAEGERALPVTLGRRLEGELDGTFKGLIDELYLFPEALSPGQIESLYLRNRIETDR